MSNLRNALEKVKNVPSPLNIPLNDIDKIYANQLLTRYNIVSYVMQQLNSCFNFKDTLIPPLPEEVLEMKPVTLANQLYSIESLVEEAAKRIIPYLNSYNEFIVDVLRMYTVAKVTTLQHVKDRTMREIIYRLPEDPEHRIYRYIELTDACTIYFIRNRYMLIVNKGTKRSELESNIDLVTVIDMGTMIFQTLNNEFDFYSPTENCSTGKFKPVHCKYDKRVMNPGVYLCDVTTTYPYVNAFAESIVSKRKNYSFNIVFPTVMDDLSLPNEIWDYVKRVFGIINLNELLNKQEEDYHV
jgi:endonuclease III-like uncharacterized protein